MREVTSSDGTAIAFDRTGAGPALILVNGAFGTRADAAALAGKLAPAFTVFAYDRRGRGDSGDTAPYAVEREVEDLAAVIAEAGGSAFVYGHSSGAVLALEAARRLGAKVARLAVYEPPLIVDGSRAPLAGDVAARLAEMVAAGRRGDAVEYFMTVAVNIPAGVVASLRASPGWPRMEALAHTLAYDSAIVAPVVGGTPAPLRRWSPISVPVLVMDGGASPAYMHGAAEALAAVLPHAQHRRFPGQEHGVADEVLVPVLTEFFRR